MRPRSNQPVNRIAFINLNGRLGTIDPDGQEGRTLTKAEGYFQFPAWSPDGRYVAAIGKVKDKVGLFVFTDRAANNDPAPLYQSSRQTPFYLYWSPDGRRISFIAGHPQGGIGLHLASVAEGRSRLVTTGQPCYWDWTPDGTLILLHTGAEKRNARLAFIDPAGTGYEENIAHPGLFQAPGVAPSGRFWAFSAVDMLDANQLVIESKTGKRRILPQNGAVALSWSPTADRLAFTNPPDPNQGFYGPLCLFDAESGQVDWLAETTVLAFFWSPDGRRIAYLTLNEADDIDPAFRIGGGRGRHTNGRTPSLFPTQPSQPEDILFDLWLVELAPRRRRRLTTFEPSPLFINQFMPFFDQYALSHRLWSPGSDALVLPVIVDRRLRIAVTPVDGRSPRLIADGVIAFWSRR